MQTPHFLDVYGVSVTLGRLLNSRGSSVKTGYYFHVKLKKLRVLNNSHRGTLHINGGEELWTPIYMTPELKLFMAMLSRIVPSHTSQLGQCFKQIRFYEGVKN